MNRVERIAQQRRALLKGTTAAALAALFPSPAAAGQSGQAPRQMPGTVAPTTKPGEPAVTAPLSRYIAASPTMTLPEDIKELGKRHILDTMASMIACRDLEAAMLARKYAAAMTGGGPATILATRERAALVDAVFASAVTGHAAEINDFSPSSYTQPGPPVLSTALLLGEQRRASGSALLNAVVTGYELTCRVPKTLGIRNLRDITGIASHGVGPVFGAAAAAASIMRMPEAKIPHLLSYCAQQASGSWKWLLDEAHVEKAFVFAGMPARNGLQAALLVDAGFTGVPDCLDVPGGWLMSGMFAGPESDLDRRYLIDRLGERFELPLVGYKRYPTGGPAQASVEGMLQLARKVDRTQIDSVHIAMPGRAFAFATAKMPALNLPYLCAIIILDGRLDFSAAHSMTRKEGDAAVRALMGRVEVVHDQAQEREPRAESARVTVTMKNGERQELFIDGVTGFPTHPMSHDEVEAKALELMTPRLGADRARRLADRIWRLEQVTDVAELITAMAS
jgi:2-methylcitrate dehydratase PrpD